jgi:hypothetical protein
MIRTIAISGLSVLLSGCAGGLLDRGDFVVVKPSQKQLEATARKVVCGSFNPITYSAKHDTPETIRQVRAHNAAYGTFRCQK